MLRYDYAATFTLFRRRQLISLRAFALRRFQNGWGCGDPSRRLFH